MIVGTAGHIDHGKTTLTRALTGVDTDRLKEEKARGISIELGYAYLDLGGDLDTDTDNERDTAYLPPADAHAADSGAASPNGVANAPPAHDAASLDDILGIIDVPGHERLVHTMASGATGIDYALLVVAADDGVMPQTREHLAILALLGVSAGAVAITKSDRVDAARVRTVRDDVAALLAGTPLADAALFETAANFPGDPGTRALLAHLRDAARHWRRRRDDGLFRLAVDRVFTLPGQGTVVTGTVFAGRVAVGETVNRVPETAGALPVRVRSIHAQNRPAPLGHAGQRCALNLAGTDRDALRRGDWIVDPRLRATSMRLDCSLTLLADAGLTLSHWMPLHVHLGSGHHVAHLALLDDAREAHDAHDAPLAAGRQRRVQLVFETPVSAVPGDRFIVRNAQATRTVGGGRVLDPFAPARRRRSAARHAWLDAVENLLATGRVDALLAESADGLATDVLMHLAGAPLDAIALPEGAVRLASRGEKGGQGGHGESGWIFDAARWDDLTARMQATLAQYHLRVPDEQGVELARLRRMVAPLAGDALWRAAVQHWLRAGDVVLSGPWLHLAEHSLRLDPADEALAARLLPRLAAGGFDPPWVRDHATAESVPEDTARTVLRKLARQGQVYQVVRDLFYDRMRIVELARLASTVAAAAPNGEISAGAYRDGTGLGRKRAIQVLEFFDRVGYTRRHRDAHLLRVDSRWLVLLEAGDADVDGLGV